MRIIKSAAAVFLCFLFYFLFRKNGIVFYSQLAALWCMQPYLNNAWSKARQRTIGTLTGGIAGLAVILIDRSFLAQDAAGEFCYGVLVSLFIVIIIYFTVLIEKRDASYFSCVVFLSIVVNHIGDANPYLFVFDRMADTMIGLCIGMGVNAFHLPRYKEKDTLFVSGMEDMLESENKMLSAYSQVELNRMLADGAHFTVSTKLTPASLMEPLRGVRLNLPVIAMDGAVMYDLKKNEYIRVYMISESTVRRIQDFLDQFDVNYFMNMMLSHTLIIQYKELKNEAESDIYEKLHISPYRNYTTKNLLDHASCVYIMLIQTKEKAAEIYLALQQAFHMDELRMVMYDSEDYPGYSYIKIYNKNATRENMLAYLQNETGAAHVITFGRAGGNYDVTVEGYDNNQVAKILKRMYEPLLWKRRAG